MFCPSFCRGSYDLNFEYFGFAHDVDKKRNPVPWVPIDTNFITPNHIKNNRVPATFEPEGNISILFF